MNRTGYSILVFTEEDINEKLFENLKNNGFKINLANDLTKISEMVNENEIQLIIIDIKSKEYGMRVLNFLSIIKEQLFIPKVAISSIQDVKTEIELLKLGLWDYIYHPFDDEELLTRINCHLLNSLYINKLVKENVKMKNLSLIDSLTGLYTRNYLVNRLVEEVSRAMRKGESLSLAIIQTGNYDEVLKDYGQGAIDHVLNQVSIIIKQLVRLSDVVSRYSEKEFAVLCPITDRSGMDIFIDRLNNKINNSVFEYNGEIIKLYVNIGVYTLESSDFNSFEKKLSNMISLTEEALERAINDEDNNVVYY